jgi:hypothetical protein
VIGYNTKNFFDTPKVIKSLDKKTRKVFARFGGYARMVAKRSIRKAGKRSKTSLPGKPPKSHEGTLKKLIFFGFDWANRSVVIGPKKSKQGNVPEVLEHGGKITITGWAIKTKKKTTNTATIEPRPFMGPAMEKANKKLPSFWQNAIK